MYKRQVPTFSTCFGEPFLPLDPSVYAAMLADKVETVSYTHLDVYKRQLEGDAVQDFLF